MKNVFIAIGGSGTKAAEALVRLLAVGFPTNKRNGVYSSAGDSLQIWRIDPDRSAGATVSLQNSIREYEDLQKHMDDAALRGSVASSRWAMDIDSRIRNLDPLQLPRAGETDNEVKSLAGVLDSQYRSNLRRSTSLLTPFYAQKDLEVEIDRGFYQKPFIGAAVMAIFAASLRDETSPGGKEAGLTAFHNNETNFFVCGSLHGGTGACGVPVMGRFLGARKKANPSWNWRVGACLLAPYCVPPQPPFHALREGEEASDRLVEDLLQEHKDTPAFAGMTPEKKRDLVRQILNGFYADPDDMEERARQGLAYYKDYSAEYFDELYLVGKPEPDKLRVWSNGGSSQSNPLNSAETVAALAALNFFSGANSGNPESYLVGSSTHDLDSQKMSVRHLPKYRLSPMAGGDEIDPEKCFLAVAALYHLLLYQIRWDVEARRWQGIEALRQVYVNNESRKEADYQHYLKAAELIAGAIRAVLDPNRALGWSGNDIAEIERLLSSDPAQVREVSGKLSKRFMRNEPRGSLDLGGSTLKLTTTDFGSWFPTGRQFTRGEYLRQVWSELFSRTQDVM